MRAKDGELPEHEDGSAKLGSGIRPDAGIAAAGDKCRVGTGAARFLKAFILPFDIGCNHLPMLPSVFDKGEAQSRELIRCGSR